MKKAVFLALFGWILLTVCSGNALLAQPNLVCREGKIYFISEAPLEIIEAGSNSLIGLIKPATKEFAFSVTINSFDGFNSPLQKEHFRENYMESTTYPKATFLGKIIEEVDWTVDGTFTVRAKGILNIHGVNTERILKSSVTIKDGTAMVKTSFTIPLADHDITIPTIVYQKIAEEIKVEVYALFKPNS